MSEDVGRAGAVRNEPASTNETMSEKNVELTRRKVLGGLAGIGVASAAAGAGTMAYFSDSETSSGNTVAAGTIDLSVSSGGSLPIDVPTAAPGDSNTVTATLANDGSIPGYLDFAIKNVGGSDNGIEDSEDAVDGAPNDTSDGTPGGDLAQYLNVKVTVDKDTSDSTSATTVFDDTLDNLTGATTDTSMQLDASSGSDNNAEMAVTWTLDSGAGNIAQGDSASFDVEVNLTQQD